MRINITNLCPICGNSNFSNNIILWDKLINEWQLTQEEVEYIDFQQGYICTNCNNNLRSMVLGKAICKTLIFNGNLIQLSKSRIIKKIKILEINEAGNLTPILNKIPGHVLIKYPEHNMLNLKFQDNIFDLVLHSDTLEHVENIITGLSECLRILKPGGNCIFTIPIIINRLTKSRKGMSDSFHGSSMKNLSDNLVYTEFGSDAWKFAFESGFSSVTIHVLFYPSGIALQFTK